MEYRGGDTEELKLLGFGESDYFEGVLRLSEVRQVELCLAHFEQSPFCKVVHSIYLMPTLLQEIELLCSYVQKKLFCPLVS